jgi:predicted DNA binding protein
MTQTIPPYERISGEFTELEFEVSDRDYFFVGLSDARRCRVRLEERIHRSDGPLIEFFTVTGCPHDAIHERADRTSEVESVRILGGGQEEAVVRVSVSGRCIVATVEGAGAIPRSIRATEGTGRVLAQVPDCVDAGAVVDSVLNRHPGADLVARRERDVSTPVFVPRRVKQVVWAQLTDRQEEVLRTAYRSGYFERPRERTGEEIADALGITSATLSQHLRAAQTNLLSFLVGDGGDDRR